MPPIRGPIDYGRYPKQRRPLPAPPTLSTQETGQNDAEHAAREAEERQKYEAARRRYETRVAMRRAQRRRRLVARRIKLVSALTLLVLAFPAARYLLTAPQFNVKSVDIEGAHITSRDELGKVQAQLVGKNWLTAPLAKAHTALRRLPTVRSVQVKREYSWPPRLLVSLQERQPFARVGGGENWMVVDESGVPFRAAANADENLLRITSEEFAPQLGEKLPSRSWQSARVLAHLLQDDKNTQWKLKRLYVDKHDFASIRLVDGSRDGLLVQLGNDRWPEKLQRAQQAMSYFASSGRPASNLNLVSYAMPIWTPRATPQPVVFDALAPL